MSTWLITGASSGIGYSVCTQLLNAGHKVIACARRLEPLAELQCQYPETLQLFSLDVDDQNQITKVVDEAFSRPIDVVLHSAGYGLVGAIEEVSVAQIQAQLSTNLLGSILFLRACLPHLRRQGYGHILQLSSESGEMSFPAISIYQASKWGVEGFCESLRQEVACFGINVTLVAPGLVDTRFDANMHAPTRLIEAYQKTVVGNFRRLHAMGRVKARGSVAKMAQAIIACASQQNPPRRLILGSDAYKNISRALNQRLAELESQKDTALATDQLSA